MRLRYIYTLYTFSLPWRFKIGIAYDVQQRIGQIQYELSRQTGKQVLIRKAMAVPVFFPESAEQRLHHWFAALRAKVPYHRGHTEWFGIVNIATLAIWLRFLAAHSEAFTMQRFYISLFLLLVPFPLDGVLLQVVVMLLHFFVPLLCLYGILYALGAMFSV